MTSHDGDPTRYRGHQCHEGLVDRQHRPFWSVAAKSILEVVEVCKSLADRTKTISVELSDCRRIPGGGGYDVMDYTG